MGVNNLAPCFQIQIQTNLAPKRDGNRSELELSKHTRLKAKQLFPVVARTIPLTQSLKSLRGEFRRGGALEEKLNERWGRFRLRYFSQQLVAGMRTIRLRARWKLLRRIHASGHECFQSFAPRSRSVLDF